jgi:molybdopterin molybdotransferase
LEDGYIYIERSCAPGNNVIFKGDEIKANNIIIKKGKRLGSPDIGVLSALGMAIVKVYRKVRVGIISTGDEIVGINEDIKNGCIRDINTYSIYSSVLNVGALPTSYGIVKDDYQSIFEVSKKAISENDVVVISGGSSVGERDETYNVINNIGNPGVLIHKIAIKPGKPTIIGRIDKCALVGLPGHPASCYVIFNIFVKRIIELMGKEEQRCNFFYAKFASNYPSNAGREEFVSVTLKDNDGELLAYPVISKSGIISQFITAQGYTVIAREKEGINNGEIIKVFSYEDGGYEL